MYERNENQEINNEGNASQEINIKRNDIKEINNYLAMNSLKDCQICFNQYDSDKHKPCVIIPCGHTFCEECIVKIGNATCPLDRLDIKSTAVNRHAIDSLPSLLDLKKPDTSFKLLKDSLVDDLNEVSKCFLKQNSEVLESQKRALRKRIDEEKKRKIENLENEAKNLLIHLDNAYKKRDEQCKRLANDLDAIKSNGELLLCGSKSPKAATSTFSKFKKQLRNKTKNFKIANINYQPTQDSNKTPLGQLKEENVITQFLRNFMIQLERSKKVLLDSGSNLSLYLYETKN